MTDEQAMKLALESAREAALRGEVPVGAMVLREGRPLAQAGNQREGDQDPFAHAELLAMREAAMVLGDWRLNDCSLYVTLEPCFMCAGAIVLARVSRVVFAAFDPKAGACGSLHNVLADPRLNHHPKFEGGLYADESAQLLRDFFAERRASKKP